MRVIVHIGYPRTGSTFLQKNIFPVHKDICFLGPKNFLNLNDIKITQYDLNLIAEQNQDNNLKNKIIHRIDKNLVQHFDKKKINIISSEQYTNYSNTINDFRDLKYLQILLNENFDNVKIDFLIVLRNQFDLIKSFYYHTYQNISNFLKIYKFESIFDILDKDNLNNQTYFPLRLFLKSYDFNYLNNKLLDKFESSNIKYLFYEDLNFDKNHFINELSNFCNLDNDYTKELFNSKIINNRKVKDNKNFYLKSYVHKIIHSKIYLFMKDKVSFKNFLKKYLSSFIYSYSTSNLKKEVVFKKKIKKYYGTSNSKFFEQTKLIDRYNYQ